jgi:tight adherence protein C
MIYVISTSVFLAAALGAFAVYWWLEYRRESLPHRLRESMGTESSVASGGLLEKTVAWVRNLGTRFSKKAPGETELVEMLSGKELRGARLLLNQAGMRNAGAYRLYLAVRLALPVMSVLIAFLYGKAVGLVSGHMLLLVLGGGTAGLLLPDFALRWKIRKRQEEVTDALPDALDLLVVCVEAGLGLNAAFVKITEEFHLSSPALSEEFDIVNREMIAGKPRQEALRALSERTGVEEVKSLVAMLIQTEKLGTSLAQSLRVHSDSLRTRRRQRAEEAAAKTTIKLIFPLVFLMFPALFIVILGPAVIQIVNVLFPVIQK